MISELSQYQQFNYGACFKPNKSTICIKYDWIFVNCYNTCVYSAFDFIFPKQLLWQDILLALGGALNFFFSGRGVRPGFSKCGACELIFAFEKGGGLVNWKFPNLGACELKMFKFGGLWANIWVKIEAVEAEISKFSQKGVLWTTWEAWKGGLQGHTSPYPLSRSVPPTVGGNCTALVIHYLGMNYLTLRGRAGSVCLFVCLF